MSEDDPQIHDLRRQLAELKGRMTKLEENADQLTRQISNSSRREIWQMAIYTWAIIALLFIFQRLISSK